MKRVLSQIVGNDALKKRLSADIAASALAHAYIIEGRKGCGKHTVALSIAAALNCAEVHVSPESVPCGICENCRKILSGISQDVITVSRESGKATLGVEAVRGIRATVSTVPGELERKVYIIEDADTMTVQAQNALLLTLEEPPPFVLFLLLCENARTLLETIRSRAPALRVEPLDSIALDRVLTEKDPRAALTKNTAPEEYAAILTAADGSVGEALRLLDSKERKLFLQDRETVESVINACAAGKSCGELSSLLSAFPAKRQEAMELFRLLMIALRDLIALSRAEHPHLCFYTDPEAAAELAARFSLSTLVSLFRAAEDAIDALSRNASLPLTLVLFTEAAGH